MLQEFQLPATVSLQFLPSARGKITGSCGWITDETLRNFFRSSAISIPYPEQRKSFLPEGCEEPTEEAEAALSDRRVDRGLTSRIQNFEAHAMGQEETTQRPVVLSGGGVEGGEAGGCRGVGVRVPEDEVLRHREPVVVHREVQRSHALIIQFVQQICVLEEEDLGGLHTA